MGGQGLCSVTADQNKILIITSQVATLSYQVFNVSVQPDCDYILISSRLWLPILISLFYPGLYLASSWPLLFYSQGVFNIMQMEVAMSVNL